VSEHLAPMISRGNGGRYVLDPKGSGAAGALGGVCTTSRDRAQPNGIVRQNETVSLRSTSGEVTSLSTWKSQLDGPEWAVRGCAGKARRRSGLLPARRSNAASVHPGGSIGSVAPSPLRCAPSWPMLSVFTGISSGKQRGQLRFPGSRWTDGFEPRTQYQTSRDEAPLASMVKTGRKDWAAPEPVTGGVLPGRLAEW